MRDCFDCRLFAGLVLLGQAAAGGVYRRGEFLPMERHRQHAAGCAGAGFTLSDDLASQDKPPAETRSVEHLLSGWIVSFLSFGFYGLCLTVQCVYNLDPSHCRF